MTYDGPDSVAASAPRPDDREPWSIPEGWERGLATGRIVILRQFHQVVEVHRAVTRRITGEDEKLDHDVSGQPVPRRVGDAARLQGRDVVPVRCVGVLDG